MMAHAPCVTIIMVPVKHKTQHSVTVMDFNCMDVPAGIIEISEIHVHLTYLPERTRDLSIARLAAVAIIVVSDSEDDIKQTATRRDSLSSHRLSGHYLHALDESIVKVVEVVERPRRILHCCYQEI